MTPRRLLASFLILALALIHPGCSELKRVQVDPRRDDVLAQARVVGITTKAGEVVDFDHPARLLGLAAGGWGLEAFVGGQRRVFPLADAEHVWIAKRQLTRGGKATAITVSVAGLVLVVALVATAGSSHRSSTATSCPYVYSWDGSQYTFDAEPYGGAIAKGFQREDWSELAHAREQDGQFRLLMTNEADETQNTDFAELLVADHPAGVKVVADEAGGLHALRALQAPVRAHDEQGRDLTAWLAAVDRRIVEPAPVATQASATRHEIVMEFARPAIAQQGWLVVNAATSQWGSEVIRRMVGLLGREGGDWLASLGQDPFRTASVYSWVQREETFRLQLEVETASGWKSAGAVLGSGPAVTVGRAVRLDLSGVQGDTVRVRVRPPLGFWAFNAFAVSYEPEAPVEVKRVAVHEARTTAGADVRGPLSASDGRYYSMTSVGDQAELTFPAPPRRDGMARSVFLHTAGWYQLHLHAAGEPNLRAFNDLLTKPGEVSRFSAAEFASATAPASSNLGR